MRALALISGGLDSTLAARVIKELGVEVIGLHFDIPFYARKKKPLPEIGIEMREIDIGSEFLEVLAHPRYGFGSHMNPCIDCKILMVKKALELLDGLGAQFIITGEVLAQRPMSQHRQALELIPKKAGAEGLVVRPLSARHLPETLPEQKGWIDRNKLLNFAGRGRSAQIALAKRFGIEHYAQPAGGCLLTDPEFAKRLKELMAHSEIELSNIKLLKTGRHFRLTPFTKLIVGRNESENEILRNAAQDNDHLFFADEHTAGPTSLARGPMDAPLCGLCAKITARFCDRQGDNEITIQHKTTKEDTQEALGATPIDGATLLGLKI